MLVALTGSVRLLSGLAIMAGITQALKIAHIEFRTAGVDRHDMCYHLGQRGYSPPLALLS